MVINYYYIGYSEPIPLLHVSDHSLGLIDPIWVGIPPWYLQLRRMLFTLFNHDVFDVGLAPLLHDFVALFAHFECQHLWLCEAWRIVGILLLFLQVCIFQELLRFLNQVFDLRVGITLLRFVAWSIRLLWWVCLVARAPLNIQRKRNRQFWTLNRWRTLWNLTIFLLWLLKQDKVDLMTCFIDIVPERLLSSP